MPVKREFGIEPNPTARPAAKARPCFVPHRVIRCGGHVPGRVVSRTGQAAWGCTRQPQGVDTCPSAPSQADAFISPGKYIDTAACWHGLEPRSW